MAPDKGRKRQAEDDLIDWFTVSYKTLYAGLGVLLVLAAGGGYYYLTRGRIPRPTTPTVAPISAATTARFTSIEGSVKVKAVGTFEWVSADKNMVLKKSDLVRTGSGSTAEITFFDNTVVHVRPDSLITIEETSEDPATKQRKVAWHISSGEVNFLASKKNVEGSSTKISTPTVETTAGDSAAGGVRVADSGDTELRYYKGSGELRTKTGERLALKENESVKVDADGKAGPKRNLPEPPVLIAPPHQAEISYMDPSRATTLLAWKPVAGAAGYHVMLDYSAYFNRPLVDRKGIPDSSVELRGLDAGKYYWHVAAVDKNGSESAFSDFARFTVTRPSGPSAGSGTPPVLIIDALDVRAQILQVKGRTEPGSTVTVNGQKVDVQGDGSFNEFITLEKIGKQVVVIRAMGLNGGVNEQKRPIVVAPF